MFVCEVAAINILLTPTFIDILQKQRGKKYYYKMLNLIFEQILCIQCINFVYSLLMPERFVFNLH